MQTEAGTEIFDKDFETESGKDRNREIDGETARGRDGEEEKRLKREAMQKQTKIKYERVYVRVVSVRER